MLYEMFSSVAEFTKCFRLIVLPSQHEPVLMRHQCDAVQHLSPQMPDLSHELRLRRPRHRARIAHRRNTSNKEFFQSMARRRRVRSCYSCRQKTNRDTTLMLQGIKVQQPMMDNQHTPLFNVENSGIVRQVLHRDQLNIGCVFNSAIRALKAGRMTSQKPFQASGRRWHC